MARRQQPPDILRQKQAGLRLADGFNHRAVKRGALAVLPQPLAVHGDILTRKAANHHIGGGNVGEGGADISANNLPAQVGAVGFAGRRLNVIRPNDLKRQTAIGPAEKTEAAHKTQIQPAAAGKEGKNGNGFGKVKSHGHGGIIPQAAPPANPPSFPISGEFFPRTLAAEPAPK